MSTQQDLLEENDRIRDVGMLDTWHFKRYHLRSILERKFKGMGLFRKIKLRELHDDLHQNQ